MKALIVGNTAYIENAISMAKGLHDLGIEHGYFGYRSFCYRYGQEEMKRTLFDTIRRTAPDWTFFQYQHIPIIKPEWFGEIKRINPNGMISLMSVDMRNELDEATLKAGLHADVCFQKGRLELYRNRGLNCHIMQEGYSDLLFHKKGVPKSHDVVFAGGFYPHLGFPATAERASTIAFLSNRFKMKVFGPGWEQVLRNRDAIGGAVKLPQINDIYNSSKIVLSINHYNDIEHYWSIRMIEGMASGSLVITKYVPGLEKYFTNFKDIVWFYSLGDCITLIEHYLTHDDEREEIARRSQAAAMKDFRWEAIMEKAYRAVFPPKGART